MVILQISNGFDPTVCSESDGRAVALGEFVLIADFGEGHGRSSRWRIGAVRHFHELDGIGTHGDTDSIVSELVRGPLRDQSGDRPRFCGGGAAINIAGDSSCH